MLISQTDSNKNLSVIILCLIISENRWLAKYNYDKEFSFKTHKDCEVSLMLLYIYATTHWPFYAIKSIF